MGVRGGSGVGGGGLGKRRGWDSGGGVGVKGHCGAASFTQEAARVWKEEMKNGRSRK